MSAYELAKSTYLIVQWIFFSSAIILFNKQLLSGDFPFPCTLVSMHMAFSGCCAIMWSAMGWVEVPKLTRGQWASGILPVGLCFAGSLVLSNAAYLYISVAFIQMIKASTPVIVLLFSFGFGLEQPNMKLGIYIVMITAGVTTSCLAQLEGNAIGVVLQLVALVCEAMRLCLVNLLLTSRGINLSSIASLYYVAPTCLLCIAPVWAYRESADVLAMQGAAFAHAGYLTLLANSSVAFLLNIATMALIKQTSALTLNVAGVFKDLLLILWSVFINGALVTATQYFGYSIAFSGVTGYSAYKRGMAARKAAEAKQSASEAQPEGQPLLEGRLRDLDRDNDIRGEPWRADKELSLSGARMSSK